MICSTGRRLDFSIRTFSRLTARLFVLFAFLPLAGNLAAQEKSVKPGVNKSFENPDVPTFVERFEREGRDVYDRRKEIVAACHIKPGMAIGDIGAGTGLFTRLFSEQVGEQGRVYAVDISSKFIDHIEEIGRKEKLTNVVGVVCKPDSVELQMGSIDRAFICDTYHHFEYPRKTLATIRQALRPGGELILIDFERIEGKSSDWILGHVRAGKAVFRKEVLEAGFELVEEKKLLKDNYFLRFRRK